MKNSIKPQVLNTIIIIVISLITVSGCGYQSDIHPDTALADEPFTATSTEILTEAEVSSLMFMVEEEKLAMDVYAKMFELYGLKIFDNINQSERRHVKAISLLIDKYDFQNPIDGNSAGVFVDDDLLQLYSDLIELGSASVIEAINVGVMIEEKDIIDIQAYLDDVVESGDIELVYTNLLNGSRSHLEAFTLHL